MSKFTTRPSFPNSNNNKRLGKVGAVGDVVVGGDEWKDEGFVAKDSSARHFLTKCDLKMCGIDA